MVPPFIRDNTAQVTHALSSLRPLELVLTLAFLSVIMFVLGFAANRSLAERPKVRLASAGRVITLPQNSDGLSAQRQYKK